MLTTQELWHRDECLTRCDSIQFGDDRVAILKVAYPPFSWFERPSEIPVRVDRWERKQDLLSTTSDDLYTLFLLGFVDFERNGIGLRATFGEVGGNGSYGFVAVASAVSNELIWLAFFEWSNPFVAVRVSPQRLAATTSSDWIFSFDLDDPTSIHIDTSVAWPNGGPL